MDNTKLKGRMSGKVQELQQPTGNQAITVTSAPETSLAPVDSTYLALTNNALDIIRANLKSQPLTLDLFDIVKSPSGGATVFEVPGLAGNEAAMELIRVTQQSFWEGVRLARKGSRVSDISHAVQAYVEAHGFSVVRDYVGHGVGRKMHEPPEVRNFGPAGHGPRLQPGMTLAVEPMVNQGDWQVKVLPDNWTVKTLDGRWAAHYENTILITEEEPEILTVTEDGGYV